MYFELVKTFDGVESYYGAIPELPYDINSNEQFEGFSIMFFDKSGANLRSSIGFYRMHLSPFKIVSLL